MGLLKVAIAGAGGRMGAANLSAAVASQQVVLYSAFDRPGSAAIGRDAGEQAGLPRLGVAIGDDIDQALTGADAVIDFTAPAASVALAGRAARLGIVHVVGTTGCSAADDDAIRAAAAAGARVVKSGNFSLGINLLLGLIEQASRALPDWDVEVLEMHHSKKVDAPSGTALMLGGAAAKGRDTDLTQHSVRSRDGHTGAREPGTIGFATLRGGNVIGEHKVILAGPSERIELGHIADSRALFADGALRAALWAAEQPPGFYSMADVLGFTAKGQS